MGSDSAKKSLGKVHNWLESFPISEVNWTIDENPSVNATNPDYCVDYEVIIKPANNKALGVTVWISGNANGFFVSDFKHAARLLNVKVRDRVSDLSCSGLEPVTHIDIDAIIEICNDISLANLNLSAFIFNGRLERIYSVIGLSNNHELPISIGVSRTFAKLLVATGFAKNESIPYEPWL